MTGAVPRRGRTVAAASHAKVERVAAPAVFPILALVLGLVAGPAAALDPVGAVNVVRSRSCGSRPASLPLTRMPVLDRAAELVAGGQPLARAVETSGYRAVHTAVVRTEGATTDAQLVELVADKCEHVGAANLRHIGTHQRGRALWIVLAEPWVAPKPDAETLRTRVLAAVNLARAQPRRCGTESFAAAAPVRWSQALENIAAAHAHDMARRGVLGHTGSDGSSTSQRASRAGYAWFAIGENVAGGQRDADEVVRHWLASPGHCANVMNGVFTEMGAGFAVNDTSELVIYWAQVFGAPDPGVPPATRRKQRPAGS